MQTGEASVTAFFPAYNDAESLPDLIVAAAQTLEQLGREFEILVVDDGSTDRTAEVLAVLQEKLRCLRVIRHAQNLGYGAALCDGFRHATKELVFYTDGDGQYDVRELRKLLQALAPEVDAVVGYKTSRADSRVRAWIGKLYARLVRALFRLRVRDVDCDFRLIRRRVLDGIPLMCHSGAICAELMHQLSGRGFQVVEVPVSHYPRRHGRSQFFRIAPILRMIFDLARLWVRLVLLRYSSAGRPSCSWRWVLEGKRRKSFEIEVSQGTWERPIRTHESRARGR